MSSSDDIRYPAGEYIVHSITRRIASRQIKSIWINKEKDALCLFIHKPWDELMEYEHDYEIVMLDCLGDCCSRSYITKVEIKENLSLGYFIMCTATEAEGSSSGEEKEYRYRFYSDPARHTGTLSPAFTLTMVNYSNGYYGGELSARSLLSTDPEIQEPNLSKSYTCIYSSETYKTGGATHTFKNPQME